MTIKRILPGKIVDTSGVVTPLHASAVKKAGYLGIVRYVPHVGSAGATDITSNEAVNILMQGLGLMLVQHVRKPLWNPGNYSGHDDAMAAVSRAFGIGYPKGAHIFLDLEGISGPALATLDYSNAWADAVAGAGYLAGAYVGYAIPLTAQELYGLHRVTSYWSDAGSRQVAVRGFAIRQLTQVSIAGMLFDPNIVAVDYKGETPVWMVP